jgi:hypothetical protein
MFRVVSDYPPSHIAILQHRVIAPVLINSVGKVTMVPFEEIARPSVGPTWIGVIFHLLEYK